MNRLDLLLHSFTQGGDDLSPQKRDRMMQVHLAQARGRVRNGALLRQSFDLMLRVRAAQESVGSGEVMDNAIIDTLKAVTDALDETGATYAVTGSVASGVHGEPVMSQDADLIVIASVSQAARVAEILTPRFYAPADMLTEAARDRSFTNVVDNRTGMKIDLSFVNDKGYLGTALGRRVRERIGGDGPAFWFVTAEDVILMKLLWRRDTQSVKQWLNALSVAQVKGARMDWKYLFEQARGLGMEEDLIKLRDDAGI